MISYYVGLKFDLLFAITMGNYEDLIEKCKEISLLSSIDGVLSWDNETTLPANGLDHRTLQFKYIADLRSKIWMTDDFEQLVAKNLSDTSLDIREKRNVGMINKELLRRKNLPADLLSELTLQSKKTNGIWKKAKALSQFSLVLPDLEKLFELNKKRANILADFYDLNDPFDALISTRDPGFSVTKISKIFNETKSFLIPLIKKFSNQSDLINDQILDIELSRESKKNIAEEITSIFNYEANSDNNAIIGEVEHPLTIPCGPRDVRVTVKYEHWEKVIFSAAHEVGHGIHRLNVPIEWYGEPIYHTSYPSLSECNSRYTENKIGRSYEFWEYFYPRFQKLSKKKFDNIGLDEFYRTINRVTPDVSRMKADEVSYGIHIIIRFEIEKDLFNDKIEIKDLPQFWNEKYDEYLGVTPSNDTEGVMQDLHWYNVYWGYFQGYALGDIMGSQLHQTMAEQNPTWADELRNGNYDPVYNFFVENVYHHGAYFEPLELIEKVTGKPLSTDAMKNHLERKYQKMFNI